MKLTRARKSIALVLAAIIIVAFSTSNSLAQTSATSGNAQEEANLQNQLNAIQAQIDADTAQLKQITGQKNTLQNKINQLKKQAAVLNAQMSATKIQIKQINLQLADTESRIKTNTDKINLLKGQIQTFMSAIYQHDDYSLLDILLSEDNLSDVLTELETYTQISDQLKGLMDQSVALNQQLSKEKDTLSGQQDEANNLLSIQTLQQTQILANTSQQNQLLTETKGKESQYQAILSDQQAQANAIRSRLYQLLGVSSQVTFGQALTIAQWASGLTGVRPAFLLAILTQESNLGKNVGTCNRPGDPPSKSYKVVMKPDRDIPPFLQITAALGMDPNVTPVSCPLHDANGNQQGWGGAMGPAQFIPSTWMGYKDKVAAITGKPANPWDIRDAFLAAAIKLEGAGAADQSREWAAAMIYFSGGTNTKYRFYGDNVVALAAQYQNDINNLNQ